DGVDINTAPVHVLETRGHLERAGLERAHRLAADDQRRGPIVVVRDGGPRPDDVARAPVVPAFGDDVGVNVDDGVRPHALPASTARRVRPARRAGRPRRWRAGRGPSAWPAPSTW